MRIVGRDRGRHAHRNAGRAIGKQVREGARQNHRFLVFLVVGRAEIDCVLIDPLEQQGRDLGHARFGVAIGGGVIAVDIAEIALPVDQRIALREVLGEPHQRIIDRLVAMRMELTDDVADDAGAFLEGRVRPDAHLAHGMDDTPMHGLQAIAHIGQGPVHDGRERIGEVTLLERGAKIDRLDLVVVAAGGRCKAFSHGFLLSQQTVNIKRFSRRTWSVRRDCAPHNFLLKAGRRGASFPATMNSPQSPPRQAHRPFGGHVS